VFLLVALTLPFGNVGALFVLAIFWAWGFLQGSTAVRRDAVPARLEVLSTVGIDPRAMLLGHWRGLTLVLRVGVWFCIGSTLALMPFLEGGDIFTPLLQVAAPFLGGTGGAAVGLACCYRIRFELPWRRTALSV
jgi:hypothetical protein